MYYLGVCFIIVLNIVIVNSNVPRNASVPRSRRTPPRNPAVLSRNATAQLQVFHLHEKYLRDMKEWYLMMETINNFTKDFSKLVNINTFGISVSIIATAVDAAKYDHLNPLEADYYTNGYRWSVTFLKSFQSSLLQGTPYAMHSRFLKQSRFLNTLLVPKWMRLMVPWVSDEKWKREEKYLALYKKEIADMKPPT